MPELKAIIFDVDGTLAETERDGHRLAFNRAFTERDLNWNWSVSLYGQLLAVAGGKERIQFYLQKYRPNFTPPNDLQPFVSELHRLKTHYYRQLLSQGEIPLRPGVKRLLIEARRGGIRLAIATTSALPNAMALLEKHLDPDWFEVLAAGDIVAHKKPASDVYRYVLEELGIPPQNCLVIEDSLAGLQAATGAGIATIITVNDYTRSLDFSGAKLVIDSLGEPDRPFQVLSGDVGEATHFDLNLARQLLATG